jgi:hypothetical protein
MLTNWRLGTGLHGDSSGSIQGTSRPAINDSGRASSAQSSRGTWNTANAARSQFSRLRLSGPRKLWAPQGVPPPSMGPDPPEHEPPR